MYVKFVCRVYIYFRGEKYMRISKELKILIILDSSNFFKKEIESKNM